MKRLVVGLVVLVALSTPAGAQPTDALAGHLGGPRADFIDQVGEPIQEDGVSIFEPDGFGRAVVRFREDRVRDVMLLADRLDHTPLTDHDDADWTIDEAIELASRFLPTDVVLGDDPESTDDDHRRLTCQSAAIGEFWSDDDYEAVGAGGDPGECGVGLLLDDDEGVFGIYLTLGTMDNGAVDNAAERVRCEPVDPSVVEGIETGLTVDGGGSLRGVQAVRSNDFEQLWFVAADIQGPGMEGPDEIAHWATNNIEEAGAGLIMAVGGFATEFSDWVDGGTTDANLSLSDDGADQAKACTEHALK